MKTSLVALTLLAITAVAVHGGFGDNAEMLRKIRLRVASERIGQLKDLGGILVVVLGDTEDTKAKARLQTEVELRLRRSGVSLPPQGSWEGDIPILMCSTVYSEHHGRLYRTVSVSLTEVAIIARNGAKVQHLNWVSPLMQGTRVVDRIDWSASRAELLIGVDDFCNEFLTANPPKKP